jgi:putative transposase
MRSLPLSSSESLTKVATNSWFTVKIQTPVNHELTSSPPLPPLWRTLSERAQVAPLATVPVPENDGVFAAGRNSLFPDTADPELVDNLVGAPRAAFEVALPERAQVAPLAPVPVPVLIRSRKIRIFPNPNQKATLLQWFGATRHIYNKCVEAVKGGATPKLQPLREAFMEADVQKNAWLALVPYDVRDNAIRDIDKAWKAHQAKARNRKASNLGLGLGCNWKFRSRRDRQQSIVVRHRDWGRKRGLYAPIFRHNVLAASEPLPEHVPKDFRVVLDRLGHFYLCLPREVAKVDDSQVPTEHHSVVSLDPGVRTFQTCYDADGRVVEWGVGDMKSLFQDCYAADRLQGRIAKTTVKTRRRRRRRAWYRILQRIQNKVHEIHKKLCLWLCRSYRVILLPKFEVSKMVGRGKRKLNSKTVRQMLTWSHYKFRQMLISKADLFPWCKVIICDEPYTSKTCGQCGEIHKKLGSSKTFRCPTCDYKADRDASAARNILLRYLTINNLTC